MRSFARNVFLPVVVFSLVWATSCGSNMQLSDAGLTPTPTKTAVVFVGPNSEYLATLSLSSPTLTPVNHALIQGNIYGVDAVNRHLLSLAYSFGTPHNYIACAAQNVEAFDIDPSMGSQTQITAPAVTSQSFFWDVKGKFLFDVHCLPTILSSPFATVYGTLSGIDVWTVAGDQFTPVAGSAFGDASAVLAEGPLGKFLYAMGPSAIEVLSVGSNGVLSQTSTVPLPTPFYYLGSMVLSPSGQYAYLSYWPDSQTANPQINIYSVSQQDGSLTLQNTVTAPAYSASLVMHPLGHFLYAFGTDISVFPIDSSGNLQNPITVPNTSPGGLAFDKAGDFAFIEQVGVATYIGMFSVDPATGNLTGIANTGPLNDFAYDIEVVE